MADTPTSSLTPVASASSWFDDDLIAGLPGFQPHLPEPDIAVLLERFESILRSGVLTKGPHVAAFEQAVADRLGPDVHAVAVANATLALEAVFRVLDVAGGEVVVPANTFVATASAAVNCGASVRFVDIDPTTMAPTAEQLDAAIGPRTRVVALCHMGGFISPQVPELVEVCRRRGVVCIEDSAQALGVTLDGVPAGTFGSVGLFSFFMGKVITAGEGGVVVTRDAKIAEAVRVLRDQGRDTDRVHRRAGFNWRMTEFQAALGVVQLARLDEIVKLRAQVAEVYDEELRDVPGIGRPVPPRGVQPNWYKYWITLDTPAMADALSAALQNDHGLRQAGPLQGHGEACSVMPAFSDAAGRAPVAERFCTSHIGLPMYPDLPLETARRVARAVRHQLGRIVDPA
jgi:perosamine synthetase